MCVHVFICVCANVYGVRVSVPVVVACACQTSISGITPPKPPIFTLFCSVLFETVPLSGFPGLPSSSRLAGYP